MIDCWKAKIKAKIKCRNNQQAGSIHAQLSHPRKLLSDRHYNRNGMKGNFQNNFYCKKQFYACRNGYMLFVENINCKLILAGTVLMWLEMGILHCEIKMDTLIHCIFFLKVCRGGNLCWKIYFKYLIVDKLRRAVRKTEWVDW